MKRKRAILLLVFALALPMPSTAAAMEDMFSVMFRMMLVMMNVMSDAMLGNSINNNSGFGNAFNNFGVGNSLGFGMGSWPMMSGLYGMNPVSGVGGFPGMSPWSGMGGVPGMSPWSGMGGFPGGGGYSPWSNPFTTGSSPYPYSPYNNAGYGGWPATPPGGAPPVHASLLEGRWFGPSGEILEVRGERFRLQQGQVGIDGIIRIENNIVNLYSPQTNTVTQYTFIRNQSDLMLQDAAGNVLSFTRRPVYGAGYLF